MLNEGIRLQVVKALVMPIIDLYDFIYAAASVTALHKLDVAYNDVMRGILGIRRSEHFRILELHKLTKLDKLADRRQYSLLKFMINVTEEHLHSRIRSSCYRSNHSYSTRCHNYIIPRFKSRIARLRVTVRGLKAMNERSKASL
jgi:hypothetical protein